MLLYKNLVCHPEKICITFVSILNYVRWVYIVQYCIKLNFGNHDVYAVHNGSDYKSTQYCIALDKLCYELIVKCIKVYIYKKSYLGAADAGGWTVLRFRNE